MLNQQEQCVITELLQLLTWTELQGLVKTLTSGIIVPLNPSEACTAILQHTASLEEFLSRQKITREILYTYLHNKNLVFNQRDKQSLKTLVLDHIKSATDQQTPNVQPHSLACSSVDRISAEEKPVEEANILALEYSKWFYHLLNQTKLKQAGSSMNAEHFFPDCNVNVVMQSPTGVMKRQENGADNVARLIIETAINYDLFFNPNVTSQGVQGKMDAHGLVMVAACGTLHQGDKCAGVFKQLFGLARDPTALNNWKVKFTELNLKSQAVVTIPALEEGELGRKMLTLK